MLKWILLRLAFLMMMKYLGVRLSPKTVLLLLGGLSTLTQMARTANVAAQRLMISHAHLQGDLNAQTVMDIGTLVLAMGACMITIVSVAAYILAVNA